MPNKSKKQSPEEREGLRDTHTVVYQWSDQSALQGDISFDVVYSDTSKLTQKHLPAFYDPDLPSPYVLFHWSQFLRATSGLRLKELHTVLPEGIAELEIWKQLANLVPLYRELHREIGDILYHQRAARVYGLNFENEILSAAQTRPASLPKAQDLTSKIEAWADTMCASGKAAQSGLGK